jgi:hypothetical protein
MVPGLSESDCQVAGLHYRQLVAEGQRQQLVASVHPASAGAHVVFASPRKQLGTLLVRVGERLKGLPGGTTEHLGSAATAERGAIA